MIVSVATTRLDALNGPALLEQPGPWPNPTRGSDMTQGICYGPECERDSRSMGLCNAHYEQTRRGRPLTSLQKRREWTADGCPCHGERWLWQRQPMRKHGGSWICRVKNREATRRRREDTAARGREAAANRESYRRRSAEKPYYERYPENYLRAAARRRALKVDAVSGPWTRAEVWNRGNGICHICGVKLDPENWHVDHVYPLSRGGTDTLENLMPTHPVCNIRKSDSLP